MRLCLSLYALFFHFSLLFFLTSSFLSTTTSVAAHLVLCVLTLCYCAEKQSLFISPSKRMNIPLPPTAPSTSLPRSLSPSKSIRSLAQHLQGPAPRSVSPTKGSPVKSRVDIASPRKKNDDTGQEDGMSDKTKKNKKGLWNLFNAEYEI